MAKLPFLKFFPRDWLGDDKLRLCSAAARGLWIDMLCLMHSAQRRGYLQTASGTPLPLEQLARMTGCSTDEVSRLISELVSSGVCDCTEHGMILSRRMVREETKRTKCADAGKRGCGNPALDPTFKGPPKGGGIGGGKGENAPQRLRSAEEKNQIQTPLPPELDTDAFRGVWSEWLDYRSRKKKPVSEAAARRQFAKLAEVGVEAAIAAIEKSIANDWQGIFPSGQREHRNGFQSTPNQLMNEVYDAMQHGGQQ